MHVMLHSWYCQPYAPYLQKLCTMPLCGLQLQEAGVCIVEAHTPFICWSLPCTYMLQPRLSSQAYCDFSAGCSCRSSAWWKPLSSARACWLLAATCVLDMRARLSAGCLAWQCCGKDTVLRQYMKSSLHSQVNQIGACAAHTCGLQRGTSTLQCQVAMSPAVHRLPR